jgi:Na+-transporting NADH:ubiquinone oxidoreductase subunit NqrC
MRPTGTGVLAFALFATAGFAAAQTAQQPMQQQQGQQQGQHQTQTEGRLHLSAVKGNTITQALSKVVPQMVPDFQGQLGSKAPDAANALPMPADVASQVPEANGLLYVKLPDRIVLIDPDTKEVAEIVTDMSTTGTGGGMTTGSGSPSGMSPSGQSPSGVNH